MLRTRGARGRRSMSGGVIVEPGADGLPGAPLSEPSHDANGGDHESATETYDLLHALQAMRIGDFSVRLPGNQTGLAGKIADTFNEIVVANERMAHQLEQVGHV